MTEKLVAVRFRVLDAMRRRADAGQGSLEYIGAILVAAAVIALVIAAVNGNAGTISTGFQNAVKRITG